MEQSNSQGWTSFDFIAMAVLLLAAGLVLTLIIKKVQKPIWRVVAIAALLLAFIYIWAELSVGILTGIGS